MDAILAFKRNPDDEFYSILGCDENSSPEQILTEYKARALECHPDKHQDDESATDRFSLVQRAKETLCDPDSRRNYDMWRGSGLALSYTDWQAKKDSIHSSMHWATKMKKEPMLEDVPIASGKTQLQGNKNSGNEWQSWTPNEQITRFRNYDI